MPKPESRHSAWRSALVEGAAEDPFLIALATLTLLADAAARTRLGSLPTTSSGSIRPISTMRSPSSTQPLGSRIRGSLWSAFRDRRGRRSKTAGIAKQALPSAATMKMHERWCRRSRWTSPRSCEGWISFKRAACKLSRSRRSFPSNKFVTTLHPAKGFPDLLPLSARLERELADARDRPCHETNKWLLLIAALRSKPRRRLSEIEGEPPALPFRDDHRNWSKPDSSRSTANRFRFRNPLNWFGGPAAGDTSSKKQARASSSGESRGRPRRAAWHRAAASDAPDEIGCRPPRLSGRTSYTAGRAIRHGNGHPAGGNAERGAAGRERGTRLLRAADVANEEFNCHMDVIGQMLADAEPIRTSRLGWRKPSRRAST